MFVYKDAIFVIFFPKISVKTKLPKRSLTNTSKWGHNENLVQIADNTVFTVLLAYGKI